MMSSTYRLVFISSTISGYSLANWSKWCSSVPPKRTGDCTSPNTALGNRKTCISCVVLSVMQWNLRVSLYSCFILICRKACFMSPVKVIGLVRFLVKISHILFCKGGPVSRHSFKEWLVSSGRADASRTIRNFVLSADSFKISLCGR